MYRNILVPTDGSKGARRGAEHAMDLAEKYDATLHTLFVVDERIYGETPALSSDELFMESVEQRGQSAMDDLCAEAERRGLRTECQCVRGLPHEAILDYAKEHDVDIIVMGKHGVTAHGRPHIGSSTERVVRLADVPVLPV